MSLNPHANSQCGVAAPYPHRRDPRQPETRDPRHPNALMSLVQKILPGGGKGGRRRGWPPVQTLPREQHSHSYSHSHSHSETPGPRAAQGAGGSALTGWRLPPSTWSLLRRPPLPRWGLGLRSQEKRGAGRVPRLGRRCVHTAKRRSVKPDPGGERDRPVNKPGHLLAGKGRDCPSSPSTRLAPANLGVPVKLGVASDTWELPVLEPDPLQGCGGCGWRSLSPHPAAQPGSPAGAGGSRERERCVPEGSCGAGSDLVTHMSITLPLATPPLLASAITHPGSPSPLAAQGHVAVTSSPAPRSAAWAPGAPASPRGKRPVTLSMSTTGHASARGFAGPHLPAGGGPSEGTPQPRNLPWWSCVLSFRPGVPRKAPGKGSFAHMRVPPAQCMPPGPGLGRRAWGPLQREPGTGVHLGTVLEAEVTESRGGSGHRRCGDPVGFRRWRRAACLPAPPLSPSPDHRRTSLPMRRPQVREVGPNSPLQRARRTGSPRRGLAGAARRRRGSGRDDTSWGPAGRGAP